MRAVDPEQVDALVDWAMRQEWTLNELVAVCMYVASEGLLTLTDNTDPDLYAALGEAVH